MVYGAPSVLVEVPEFQYKCAKCGGRYAFSPFTRCAFHRCPPVLANKIRQPLRLVRNAD